MKWFLRIVMFMVLAGIGVAFLVIWRWPIEAARMEALSHAELEAQMRERFDHMTCPGAQRGDVCLDYPSEGRCLSGRYIDYRTVWDNVVGDEAFRAKLNEVMREVRTPRGLANWFACQGFGSIHAIEQTRDTEYRVGGPRIYFGSNSTYRRSPPAKNCHIGFQINWVRGFGAFGTTDTPWPMRIVDQGYRGTTCIAFGTKGSVIKANILPVGYGFR